TDKPDHDGLLWAGLDTDAAPGADLGVEHQVVHLLEESLLADDVHAIPGLLEFWKQCCHGVTSRFSCSHTFIPLPLRALLHDPPAESHHAGRLRRRLHIRRITLT